MEKKEGKEKKTAGGRGGKRKRRPLAAKKVVGHSKPAAGAKEKKLKKKMGKRSALTYFEISKQSIKKVYVGVRVMSIFGRAHKMSRLSISHGRPKNRRHSITLSAQHLKKEKKSPTNGFTKKGSKRSQKDSFL